MEVHEVNWQAYRDASGTTFHYPVGWKASRHPSGAYLAISADDRALVLMQELPPGANALDVVLRGAFPGAAVLQNAQAGAAEHPVPGRAACHVVFRLQTPAFWIGLVSCESSPDGMFVSVCAGKEPLGLESHAPVLWAVTRSFTGSRFPKLPLMLAPPLPTVYAQMPKPAPITSADIFMGNTTSQPAQAAAPPPQPQHLTFVRFTDPQMGTFHVDVPSGWRIGGGFYHAGLGDRRLWTEAHTPAGVSVWFGDPKFPQVFYHNPMMWGENFVPYPQGCTFLNLEASAKKLARHYLEKNKPEHLGPVQKTGDRDRKDLAQLVVRRHPELGSLNVTVHEAAIRSGGRTGRCLAFSYGNKGAMFGDNWIGNVVCWLAPPGMETIAEQVAMRMVESFELTPQYNQIMMRDEAIIAGNGNAALVNQQQWFQGQQAVHRAQEQMGNVITNRYWEQQRVNDSIVHSWERNQHMNDDIFQRGSEAIRDSARLYDETLGKEYVVPAGSNYYWVDSTSGTVVGTETDTPPDYQRDYRPLKKL